MNSAVIELGSNVDPKKNVPAAIQQLAEFFQVKTQSQLRWTEPVGDKNQPRFLNGAVFLATPRTLQDVKSILSQIERALGRVKAVDKFSPRPIDLDVIIWNGAIVHQDFYTREFVKQTVLEALLAGQQSTK